ncbi:beta-1,4-galactosyltransferase galt-1 [Amia ocellicauda]|uniref:beta-1,4-galactosyltransferase galt-1 n=1 Tax=Amia ocellicauda TaxID=2972642 RepID=UPI003463CE06
MMLDKGSTSLYKRKYLLWSICFIIITLIIFLAYRNNNMEFYMLNTGELQGNNNTKGNDDISPMKTNQATESPNPPEVCGAPAKIDPLVPVRGMKTIVVAAYLDKRDSEHVRVISIVYRSEMADHHCLFCCGGRKFTSRAQCHIHRDHFGFVYGTADLFCKIPQGCSLPTHLAVYTPLGGDQDVSFLPIHNSQPQPQTNAFPYDFTVCISTMYGNFNNVLQLVQTIEMYKLLGVQKVAIYKNSCSPDTQRVLDFYHSTGLVDIIPWPITSYINVSGGWRPSEFPGDLHYYGQLAALNDCVYRYMYKTKYVALNDIDEIILPLKHRTWNEMMEDLEQQYGPHTGFEFESHVFPQNINEKSGRFHLQEWKDIPGVNVLEHIYREPNKAGVLNAFKVIVNPRLVQEVTVHGFLNFDYHSIRVQQNFARMYHIRRPQRHDLHQSDLIRDDHLWSYSEKLVPAVNEVLKKSNLERVKAT